MPRGESLALRLDQVFVDTKVDPSARVVRVHAPAVFGTDASQACCAFLTRIFGLQEIRSIQLDFRHGMAEFRYLGDIPPATLLDKMAEVLRHREPPLLRERLRHLLSPPSEAAVTIYRHESALSTWEVLGSGPGTMRLRHDAVRTSSRGQQVNNQLAHTPGIRRVHWRRLARELDLEFDASWDPDRLLALLDDAARDVLASGWSRPPLSRMTFQIETKDIEGLAVVMVEQMLGGHGIRIPQAELRLVAPAEHMLDVDLEIQARRGILRADMQLSVRLAIDDQRTARLSRVQVTGHGILGRLLAALARPQAKQLATQQWSLDEFMPRGFSLKDIQFTVSNAVAICVKFEPCFSAIGEAEMTNGQPVGSPAAATAVGPAVAELAERPGRSVIGRGGKEEELPLAHDAPRRGAGRLARGLYWTCFGVSFLASFPPLLLANCVPRQSAVARGCADGRNAARRGFATLTQRVPRAAVLPRPAIAT